MWQTLAFNVFPYPPISYESSLTPHVEETVNSTLISCLVCTYNVCSCISTYGFCVDGFVKDSLISWLIVRSLCKTDTEQHCSEFHSLHLLPCLNVCFYVSVLLCKPCMCVCHINKDYLIRPAYTGGPRKKYFFLGGGLAPHHLGGNND